MRTKINDSVRQTYRIPEAAQVAGTGERFIRNGISSGVIPHRRLGNKIIISRKAFHRWLDGREQGGERRGVMEKN